VSPIVVTGGVVDTGFGLVIDPLSEDAANVELNIADGSSYRPTSIDCPRPPLKSVWASSFDTEGALPADAHGYENREITIGLRRYGTSSANLLTQLGYLAQKEAKINRAAGRGNIGGTLKLTFPSGDSYVFDLVGASGAEQLHQAFISRQRTDGEIKFTALPFARGPEVQVATSSGNGVMVFTAAAIKGEVSAAGRLVVGATSQDQWAVHVGLQSEHHDAAATAALSFNGTDLTPLGTSTDTGSAIRNTDLIPTWQAIGSTEIAGTGHMTHVGDFQVWVRTRRPAGNTGAVSLRLSYAQGSTFRNPTTNPQVDFDVGDREGVDCWSSLGQVHLPEPVLGSNKWQGRFEALSTVVGDELDIKAVRLLPTTEGYIELSALQLFDTPSSFVARSEFSTEAGVITGDSLAIGGTWTGAGDADDFSAAAGVATRTAVSDADVNTGRYAIAGTTTSTNQIVQVDFKYSAGPIIANTFLGVIARYTDTSNYLRAGITWQEVVPGIWFPHLMLEKRVAGTVTELDRMMPSILTGSWQTLRLMVDAAGRIFVWLFPTDSTQGDVKLSLYDPVLATGGTLASGKAVLYDAWASAVASTRSYDNFQAFVPAVDAAIFAGRELELRHNGAMREETTAGEWSNVPERRGNYLRIPCAGMEGRTARLIVAGYRNDPDTMPNDIDDALTATLYATPRYLSVPEP